MTSPDTRRSQPYDIIQAFEKIIKKYRWIEVPSDTQISSKNTTVVKISTESNTASEILQILRNHTVSKLVTKPTKQLKTPLLTLTECDQKYHLLVMITTQPNSFERRSNIRTTWASTWHHRTDLLKWKTVFQLGQSEKTKVQEKVRMESAKHGDMIIGDFIDTFYKLPIKVIMAFEWATKFCDFEYLIKTDDDVFVNIPNIFKFLKSPDYPKIRLYAGNVHFAQDAIRSPRIERHKKYKVTREEYPYNRYPRFCSGGGMVFSRDVVADMVNIHKNSKYFKLDDVYIGMLALRLGVDAHHGDKFRLDSTDCYCDKNVIVSHGADSKHCMDKLYNC